MTAHLKARRYCILPMLLCVCVISLSFPTGLGAQVGSDAMADLLPRSGFSEGWVLDGTIRHYTAENLYVYINGEAELYLPYGFEVLGSAFYSRGENAGSGIVADVYRMRSLLDAFGIYSNYRDAGAEHVKIGAEGFIGESQLMFFKDRYFVRLSVSGTVTDERVLLMRCAEAIAGKIPGSPSQPEVLGILDIPGVAPDTVRYIAQSVLGYVFFRRGLTAETVVEGEPARIFVILCGSPEGSSRTLGDYINYLKESGVVADRRGSGKEMTLIAGDPLYKGTVIRTSGGYLFGVTKLKDPSKAIPVLGLIESRINRP
ncbi:MAG: hypothetical protein A4E64_00261 [Syntrophorhabdus sp. PtaU1.Bin058]|nr:MAG: hypothetical protein A4E64_00261 [Syntrophorhabdus sp. PtaU1.Bin058]